MSVLLTTALVLGLNVAKHNPKPDTIEQKQTQLNMPETHKGKLVCEPDGLVVDKSYALKTLPNEAKRAKQNRNMLARLKFVNMILDLFTPKVPKPHTNMDVSQTLYEGPVSFLDQFLGEGKLKGQGRLFYEAQEKYGINATFLIAVADLESAGGQSKLAQKNNNFGGMKGKKGWLKFESVEAGIDGLAANLKKKYIDDGLITISQINKRYAENPKWGSAVVSKMDKMYKYAHTDKIRASLFTH